MRPWLALVVLLGACASPSPRHLEHDYALPGVRLGDRADDTGDGPDGRLLLFLNFDGANILRVANDTVSENSANDASWIPDTYALGDTKAYAPFDASPYTAYGFTDASARQDIVDHVTGWYAPFNVAVVATRPASGRYTMIMVGEVTADFLDDGSGTVGDSTLDCGNESEINVGFDFAGEIVANAPVASASDAEAALLNVAQTAAHEAGHTFGLEHVNDTRDIMNPDVSADVEGFLDMDSELSSSPSSCTSGATTENTHARLLANVGAAPDVTSVDLGAPDLASGLASDAAGGGVGAACTDSTQCASNLCATSDTTQFCTVACTTSAMCPASFTCGEVDGARYCLPKHASGCSYGSGSPGGSLVLALLLLLIARRSSRPSAT